MKYELTNTGVKASYPGMQNCQHPSVQIPGLAGSYRALQFHIHSSSEHTIDGKYFGAELHTVHQEVDGDRYAVVGMMIDPSADIMNEVFQQVLDGWAYEMESNQNQCGAIARGGDRKLEEKSTSRRLASDGPFSPYMLIPQGSAYYHYDGGLTTPPCSEVVWWNLVDTPVSITPAQYQQLMDNILNYTDLTTCEPGTAAGPAGSTSRPPQPLNGRYVERICPVGFDDGESSSSTVSMAAMGAAAVAGAALLF
jgi:carbonic anhydrase